MLVSSLPVDGLVPIGTIIAYAGLTPSQWERHHWLECDGRPLNGTLREYCNLFTVIGTQYGGSGEMFNLPDLRGMFLRGVGTGTTNDPDTGSRYLQGGDPSTPTPNTDLVGSVQADAYQQHTHPLPVAVLTDGGPNEFNTANASYNFGQIIETALSGTSTETRPKNVYVYFLIYIAPPLGEVHQGKAPHA